MSNKLAILGGDQHIVHEGPQFTWPIITEETEAAVVAQMRESISIYNRSGIFERFENIWSQYHGVEHSLLTNSGTSSILSMFVGIGLAPSDEVICPAYTFHATASPLFILGAKPVLCDCDETGNIDPSQIEALITEKTRAVIITHMWGVPCDVEAIAAICKKHGIKLLEDCSHAHCATVNGQPVGSFGDAAAWSLQGPKLVSGGEGGIMTCNDEEIYARATLLGHYNKRCKTEIPHDHPLYQFSVTGMGLKLRAHTFAVAMAEQQFSHIGEWIEQKRAFAKRMSEGFSGLPGVSAPKFASNADPAWYAYVLQYNQAELGGLPIEKFHEALLAEGAIEADRPGSTGPLNNLPLYQRACQLFPGYESADVAYLPGQYPGAERFFTNAIKLPVWALPEDEALVDRYVGAFAKVVENHEQLL